MSREKYIPTKVEISKIEKEFLAGKTIQGAKEALELEIPNRCYSEVRKNLFNRIKADSTSLHRLANGPLLNACEVIRYSSRRKPMQQELSQTSILDICDGFMNAGAVS